MNEPTEHDALDSVLADLREIAVKHPEYKSALIRLLRAVRDLFSDLAVRIEEDAPRERARSGGGRMEP